MYTILCVILALCLVAAAIIVVALFLFWAIRLGRKPPASEVSSNNEPHDAGHSPTASFKDPAPAAPPGAESSRPEHDDMEDVTPDRLDAARERIARKQGGTINLEINPS